jgi:hypothetical protein
MVFTLDQGAETIPSRAAIKAGTQTNTISLQNGKHQKKKTQTWEEHFKEMDE